jgi:hypothetical protein
MIPQMIPGQEKLILEVVGDMELLVFQLAAKGILVPVPKGLQQKTFGNMIL